MWINNLRSAEGDKRREEKCYTKHREKKGDNNYSQKLWKKVYQYKKKNVNSIMWYLIM